MIIPILAHFDPGSRSGAFKQLRHLRTVKYLRQSRRHEKQGTAQSGLKWALPKGGFRPNARPRSKDLLRKNHEAPSISWKGRAAIRTFDEDVLSCKGHRPVARSARRILRKPVEASKKRASPANAFCAEAP
jgi:hypothetical protein